MRAPPPCSNQRLPRAVPQPRNAGDMSLQRLLPRHQSPFGTLRSLAQGRQQLCQGLHARCHVGLSPRQIQGWPHLIRAQSAEEAASTDCHQAENTRTSLSIELGLSLNKAAALKASSQASAEEDSLASLEAQKVRCHPYNQCANTTINSSCVQYITQYPTARGTV